MALATGVVPSWSATSPPLGGELLNTALKAARREGRAALAAYMPAGYPTLATSVEVLHALAQHADVVEVGLPFSDPVLDGPLIEEASAVSLAAGFRIKDLFDVVEAVSSASAAAVLVMSYWNPIARYGPERFATELAAAGGAGLVVPDLPVEEAGPWLRAAQAHHLDTVFVVAPNSSDERLSRVCAAGSGMVYAPAAAGVTGSGKPTEPGLPRFVQRLRGVTHLPVAVGIGVSTPEQARDIARYADCVVVGSAFIRRFRQTSGPHQVRAVAQLADELTQAMTRSTPHH
jgi:tryptophan synthase alpha chain